MNYRVCNISSKNFHKKYAKYILTNAKSKPILQLSDGVNKNL